MTTVLHIELVQQTQTALELRLWRDNPNEVSTRVLANAVVAPLIVRAESDYYSPLPAKLAEIGQTLFQWLDGGERWLTREIRAAASAPVVLCIATPKGLGHLPWEVLHDGTEFLIHAVRRPVLPVRWSVDPSAPVTAAGRPLQVLFMASSPENVKPILDFEREEHAILEATRLSSLDLLVEESGCLDELGSLMQQYDETDFDVLHITGHAGHDSAGQPVLLLEDAEGRREDVTAEELARTLPHRPPLLFLSGCRTGQDSGHGEIRSLAEQLISRGFRCVLGWGRPVRDGEATLVAQLVYEQLAMGEPLPSAIIRAHARLQEAEVRDWHLLRVFCAGAPPGALVVRKHAPGRKHLPTRHAEAEFLDPLTRRVKVATRGEFVGRRRLLQRSVRFLRHPVTEKVGLLLHGQGGRGKSSVAARLCDRLRHDFQRVVVIGRFDETSLVNAWAPELPDEHSRHTLRSKGDLRFRIEDQLRSLATMGGLPPLFVLDDFEQNQPRATGADLGLEPHTADSLVALLQAVEHTGIGRVVITCRYALPIDFAQWVEFEAVPPLDTTEQQKQFLRLNHKTGPINPNPELIAAARAAADGNPRLVEWLHTILAQPALDHADIIGKIGAAEERFRDEIAARSLVDTLSEEDKSLLGGLLLLTLQVPIAAVRGLVPTRTEADLAEALRHAADLSLVDITEENGELQYRVPQQLAGGIPPVLPRPTDEEVAELSRRMCGVLVSLWGIGRKTEDDPKALQIIQLALDGSQTRVLSRVSDVTSTRWLTEARYQEVRQLLNVVLEPSGRHHMLLLNLAQAVNRLGEVDAAEEALKEAEARCPVSEPEDRAAILYYKADWLDRRGEKEQALRIYRDELLPLYEALEKKRESALIRGKIAAVLNTRGDVDEALRIFREEVVPVFESLGDIRNRAVALGTVADILQFKGELKEAYRIRNEEMLPAFVYLGDIRERALTLGRIAEVLFAQGELDEAVRIRRDHELPIYERLGDVRELALVWGKIADVFFARGDFDEVLRIRRDVEIPIYEQLREPRLRAVALGQVADVLYSRGELEASLRIRLEEEMPIYQRLSDIREIAITTGKIADIIFDLGDMDTALRIRREKVLPVYEHLGDVRELVVARTNLALMLWKRGNPDDSDEIKELLAWSYRMAMAKGLRESAHLTQLYQQLGFNLPALE